MLTHWKEDEAGVREHEKKNTFLAEALTPTPPQLFADIAILCFFHVMYKYIHMLLKYIKNILGKMILTNTLAKISQNILQLSIVSEHSKHFFLFFRKKHAFFSGGRGDRPPPPLADVSYKDASFFWRAPLGELLTSKLSLFYGFLEFFRLQTLELVVLAL